MKRLEIREVQWFRGEYREKRYGGARRGKGKNRYVIWLLFLLTFTLVLPSVFVRAETGQITEKTNTNLQPDTVKTDLQSDTIDTTRTDTMQNLLDDLETYTGAANAGRDARRKQFFTHGYAGQSDKR